MERYEHPDMTATLGGQELPDLDERTLAYVLRMVESMARDRHAAAVVLESRGDFDGAVTAEGRATAYSYVARRVAALRPDVRHAR